MADRLSISATRGDLQEVRRLIEEEGVNPTTRATLNGLTPLHLSCQNGRLQVVRYLIEEQHCDPKCVDKDGRTLLHYACDRGHTEVVKYLLVVHHCDPNRVDKNGRAPLDLAVYHPAVARELIKAGAKSTTKPPQPPVKVFIVGNPSAGKSSLTKALQTETSALGAALSSITGPRLVSDVEQKTAGIAPCQFTSRKYGHVTFYDFAGQQEYHASHAAMLQNFISSSAPLFIIVVNLCDSEEDIKQMLVYWISFLANQCTSVTTKPHVIIVGSHSDVVRSRGEDPRAKVNMEFLQAACVSSGFHISKFIPMDCRQYNSRGMAKLADAMKESCDDLRKQLEADRQAKLNEALKKGKVDLEIIKCVCQGPARVGKTHVKSLIMKKTLRHEMSFSTNAVEKALRVVCTEKHAVGDVSWEEINTQKLLEILANKANSLPQTQPMLQQEPEDKQEARREAGREARKEARREDESEDKLEDELLENAFIEEPDLSPSPHGNDDRTRLKCMGKVLKQMAEQNQDLTVLSQKWVYFVDSGGQSQFHNLFQAFVPNTSVLLLVFKLTEKLSNIPKNYYFSEDGKCLHLKGNNATIEDTLRSISSTLCTSGSKGRVLCVGTFRDEYDEMNEEQKHEVGSIEDKDDQLKTLFKQSHLSHCFSPGGSGVIFPVNGLQAKESFFDDEVVVEIRRAITQQAVETKSVPLSWFALELALEEKAEGCEVLTLETCEEIASQLSVKDLQDALEFLHNCSLLLYYKEQEVVITDPQVMLNVLTHLTVVFYKLKNNESLERVPHGISQEEFDSFTKNAIITFNFFKELRTGPEQERKILTNEKLLQIFQNLLLAVKIEESRFFLPALLPTVSLEEIRKLRKQHTSLVLFFTECSIPCGCEKTECISPCGLFCASVVKLLSTGWTLYKQSPTYSNCITLHCNKPLPVVVKFVDSFEHFEVHAVNCLPECLPEVKRMIEDAINAAIEDRKYKLYSRSLQTGFFCRECNDVARLVYLKQKVYVSCSAPHCTCLDQLEEERMWINGMMYL